MCCILPYNFPLMHRTHTCGEIDSSLVGKRVVVAGWVVSLRELGKLNFVILRDRYGEVQVVFEGKDIDFGLGYVLKVKGEVRRRPQEGINPKMKSGEVEIYAERWEILNESKPLPFLPEDRIEVQEETRLKHRVIDLRRPKMTKKYNLKARNNPFYKEPHVKPWIFGVGNANTYQEHTRRSPGLFGTLKVAQGKVLCPSPISPALQAGTHGKRF
jgi:Aspartyl-tRNA synthetase